jgi:Transcription termination factor
MARLSARRIALKALRTWRKERRFADSIVSEFLAKAELPDSDRAFALELVYGVLRNLTLLDFWIGCLRASRVNVDVRDVLRLGLYQLFFLKTAPHAAVHETVGLVPQRQRPIVNGMLRAAIRRRASYLHVPMRSLCLFEPRIHNFSSSAGSNYFGAHMRKSSASGTIFPRQSTDESIN